MSQGNLGVMAQTSETDSSLLIVGCDVKTAGGNWRNQKQETHGASSRPWRHTLWLPEILVHLEFIMIVREPGQSPDGRCIHDREDGKERRAISARSAVGERVHQPERPGVLGFCRRSVRSKRKDGARWRETELSTERFSAQKMRLKLVDYPMEGRAASDTGFKMQMHLTPSTHLSYSSS